MTNWKKYIRISDGKIVKADQFKGQRGIISRLGLKPIWKNILWTIGATDGEGGDIYHGDWLIDDPDEDKLTVMANYSFRKRFVPIVEMPEKEKEITNEKD